jgi:cephalosporin-C deacetylase-like acetyl esterase
MNRLFLTSLLVAVYLPAQVAAEETSVDEVSARSYAKPRNKNTTSYELSVTTDRVAPIYKKGEEVRFTLDLAREGKRLADGKVKWSISKDGLVPPMQEGVADVSSGPVVVTGKLDEPGFLQCRADVLIPGFSVPTVRAAAAVDPLEIKPSVAIPDDFEEFWQHQKEKLRAVPSKPDLTMVKARKQGIECFDVQDNFGQGNLSGYLAMPAGAKMGRLPAILLCHGAGVASARQGIAEDWAKDGFLALDFNAHGLPNAKEPAFYKNLQQGDLKEYYLHDTGSRDTMFFRMLYLRVQRGLDILTARPEWDGRILVAYGRSQGGAQAIAAAGLDPRVTFFVAQIPAVCDVAGPLAGRIGGWPKAMLMKADGTIDRETAEASRYFDGTNFAQRTKAGAYFTLGFVDASCPPTGVYAAYNEITGPKNMLDQYLLGHHPSAEADEGSREAVLQHVKTLSAAKP